MSESSFITPLQAKSPAPEPEPTTPPDLKKASPALTQQLVLKERSDGGLALILMADGT